MSIVAVMGATYAKLRIKVVGVDDMMQREGGQPKRLRCLHLFIISYILRNNVLYCSILDTMEYYLRHIARQQLLKHLAQMIPWLPKCSTDLRFRQAPRGYVGLVHWLGTRVTCPSSHTSPSSPAL